MGGAFLLLALLVLGTLAYLVFAWVARFFFGTWGFVLVSMTVVALLIPPYLELRRQAKRAPKPAAFYNPRPEKTPGRASRSPLEAAVLASFILGVFGVLFFVVGDVARGLSAIGGYSNFGLEVAGIVLGWVGFAVIRAWFWTRRSHHDLCDPEGSFP